ncbi:MAG: hypothetical protein WA089_18985, partial [Anaerolineae bacterium]
TMTVCIGRVCRRPEIGDRLALGGASAAVHGQAVGREGVAGSAKLVRSGSAGGGVAQHSVQPTGEDLGRLTMLATPAADAGPLGGPAGRTMGEWSMEPGI